MSRTGYARGTNVSTTLTNRETFGGNSKAGLGRHIGMGQFVHAAIVNGASGHPATSAAGPYYFKVYGRAYPISTTNQLSRVGGRSVYGMFGPSADGVNTAQRNAESTWILKYISKPMRNGPFPIYPVAPN
tara:strand:- start:1139 stop:1528 length:390 start_codon:yes stop_codon:yes gene_type:complete